MFLNDDGSFRKEKISDTLKSINSEAKTVCDLRESVEVSDIYIPDGSDEAWYYTHHPFMTKFKGRYYGFYSSARRNEDDIGQRVMMATSDDFKSWKIKPAVDILRGEHTDETLTCAGVLLNGEKLTLFYFAYEYGAATVRKNEDGSDLRPEEKDSVRERRRSYYVETEDGETWSEPVCLGGWHSGNLSPERFGNLLLWAGYGSYSYTEDLTGRGGWNTQWLRRDPESEKPRHITESAFYRTADGTIFHLSRTDATQVFAAASFDGGYTFTDMYRTRFTDYDAKFQCGTLPDGRYYYIGNKSRARAELFLMISENGIDFDTHYLLGDIPYTQKRKGMYKGGNYGYPTTYIDGEYLHVIYSRGKEALSAVRVKLTDIGVK
ncbi:MAG: exo-alpha-sialidase [Clostridia bacterium]|nr:exo-alpha-sialidase [Clostridia bacterium]